MCLFRVLTQAEFARQQGWSRSYVTQLKQDDRLVLVGGKVDAAASLLRIKSSEDPNRQDVQQRHAAARSVVSESDADKISSTYQQSRAIKERYNALQAKADYELNISKLVEKAEVIRAGAEMGALLRTTLENLQDSLSSELAAEPDVGRIYAVLGERFESLLHDMSVVLMLDKKGR